MDDDEKVLVGLAPDGRVAGIRDELLIQVVGNGDYVLVLPGRVEAVTNHGGDISLASKEAGGTTVTLRLPLAA